jgi:hypothetical protein
MALVLRERLNSSTLHGIETFGNSSSLGSVMSRSKQPACPSATCSSGGLCYVEALDVDDHIGAPGEVVEVDQT